MSESGTTSILSITFPDKLWLGAVGRKYPYYQFIIRSFIPIKQDPFVGNALITISGKNPMSLIDKIKEHPSLKSFFLMEESPTQITINTQTKDNYLLNCIIKNSIIINFPIEITKGIAEFVINGTRDNIDKFIDELNDKGIHVEIKSIGNYTDEKLEQILTSRQYFIYNRAKEEGYYNNPRDLTLTELAEKLDLAKSSLSSMLQRIHNRLLGQQR
ncbi:MAG: hypothetical protein GF364_04505 [Candidatus Lokiarchaeota archaeon]|nr:hypothetical protein [Candidatus Lokiarchaeota archaeon]